MNPAESSGVILALRDPRALLGSSPLQWEALVRQARRTNLLSRVAESFVETGLLAEVPAQPRVHMEAACKLAKAQADATRREVVFIDRALAPIGAPIVLLKGAAYLLAGLPAARGRTFSDIDILVPRNVLSEVEAALMLNGWVTAKHAPYDQRYYRRWMHELPPLAHVSRQTLLDVHHAILPTTARLKPDSAMLLSTSRALSGQPRLRVLAPVDMMLHSAVHLFCNEEVGNGLRDLVDLDSLLRDFSHDSRFWAELNSRAAELDLTRPLFYALRYAAQILNTPVPSRVLHAADSGRPPSLLQGLMDALFLQTLHPERAGRRGGLASLARGSLYLRAHWLRMPPMLLAQHLTIKALRREERHPG